MTKQASYFVRTSWISLAAFMAALGGPLAAQEAADEDQVITNEESEGPGAVLYISPSDTRRVQQQLNQAGYDSGNVDGDWGDQTVSALCSFQEAEGIEPTGQITPETLAALDLGDVFADGAQEDGGEGDDDQVVTQEASNGEGVPLYLSTATVRQIQQQLNQDGYDAGNVNGVWGDQFATALTNYQEAEGLEPTGTVTVETLQALDVSFDRAEQNGDDQVITQETADAGACGGAGGTEGSTTTADASGTEGDTAGSAASADAGGSGGTEIYLSTSTIREIKQQLNQAGYDAGEVDGTADEQLASALESYQEAEGLEPTGTLTTRTVASLDDVTDISFLSSGGGDSSGGDDNSDDEAEGSEDTSGDNNSGDDSEGGNDNSGDESGGGDQATSDESGG